ncbi:hypothetical protein M8C21_006321, partial [Ambrosia artemisiifolia]
FRHWYFLRRVSALQFSTTTIILLPSQHILLLHSSMVFLFSSTTGSMFVVTMIRQNFKQTLKFNLSFHILSRSYENPNRCLPHASSKPVSTHQRPKSGSLRIWFSDGFEADLEGAQGSSNRSSYLLFQADSIYFEEEGDGCMLYIIQYILSSAGKKYGQTTRIPKMVDEKVSYKRGST